MSIFRTLASSGEDDSFLVQHNMLDDCIELHVDMACPMNGQCDRIQLVIADDDAKALLDGIAKYFCERAERHSGEH